MSIRAHIPEGDLSHFRLSIVGGMSPVSRKVVICLLSCVFLLDCSLFGVICAATILLAGLWMYGRTRRKLIADLIAQGALPKSLECLGFSRRGWGLALRGIVVDAKTAHIVEDRSYGPCKVPRKLYAEPKRKRINGHRHDGRMTKAPRSAMPPQQLHQQL